MNASFASMAACISSSDGSRTPTLCINFLPMSCIDLADLKSSLAACGSSPMRLKSFAIANSELTMGVGFLSCWRWGGASGGGCRHVLLIGLAWAGDGRLLRLGVHGRDQRSA